MIYLLGQILLCLALALLAGWFIGWSWRGFREQDRVEDLRRTLRATEEVKDRELSEAERRVGALQTRAEHLERRAERLADELATARGAGNGAGSDDREARARDSALDAAPGAEAATSQPGSGAFQFGPATADIEPLREQVSQLGGELRRERERRREAETALADRSAESTAVEAELEALRAATGARAEGMARLERQLIALEPLEERLRDREAELAGIRAQLRDRGAADAELEERARSLHERLERLEGELRDRDRTINELRNRCHDTVAELEGARLRVEELEATVAEGLASAGRDAQADAERAGLTERLADCGRRLQQAESTLAEARVALQRQIERNRKQEAVHQRVVANLRAELRDRVAPSPAPPETPSPAPPDDLCLIRGIGPKIEELLHELGITRFAQIAAWSDTDIDRVASHLGAFRDRVRRDDWVGNARRQHVLKYGGPPHDADWWLPE